MSNVAAAPSSFWLASLGHIETRRKLDSDISVDIAIVGGGFTGLYLAYYLKKHDPALRISLLEARYCGFGASGRNGGWVSALVPFPKGKIEDDYSLEMARAVDKAMVDGLEEIQRVIELEAIDCEFRRGGTLFLARNKIQEERLKNNVEEENRYRHSPPHVWLDSGELSCHLKNVDALGAAYDEACARVQPAKLVRGLADVVESLGVDIYEDTSVVGIVPGSLTTRDSFKVRAKSIVQCTEAFSSSVTSPIGGSMIPIYSLMVITQPLADSFFDNVGWSKYETITDGRNLIIYAQRTDDNRIAIGGRGAPYSFGSKLHARSERNPKITDLLVKALKELFPHLKDVKIDYEWGGAIAATRDLIPNIYYDEVLGIGASYGYVGDGVTSSNVAARTLRDLVLGEEDTELTSLPWVNHRSRQWEPEPLRYLGVNGSILVARTIDYLEQRDVEASFLKWVLRALVPK